MIILMFATALFSLVAPQVGAPETSEIVPPRTMSNDELIDLTLGLWAKCADNAAKEYAKSKETADVVTDAAMAKCVDSQNMYLRSVKAVLGDLADSEKMRAELDNLINKQRKKIRDMTLVTVFDIRSKNKS